MYGHLEQQLHALCS